MQNGYFTKTFLGTTEATAGLTTSLSFERMELALMLVLLVYSASNFFVLRLTTPDQANPDLRSELHLNV